MYYYSCGLVTAAIDYSVRLSVSVCVSTITQKTRKRFSEKPIVAFTNSTVFILDFYIYMTKPVWSHVLAWSALPTDT